MVRSTFFHLWVLWVPFGWAASQAVGIIDCTNEDIVTSIFNEPIPLDFNGTIQIYENITIDKLLATSVNNELNIKYIDARLFYADGQRNGSKNLEIFTTDDFGNYAKEQTATRITLKIVMSCNASRERTLMFFQPLREGNYFRPVFSSDVYEIPLPTPIFRGFDLTYFIEISARDDDLGNNQVTFTSNKAADYGILVGTRIYSSSDDGKKFYAKLILERSKLSMKETKIQFEIIATDNGTSALNATAEVIIYPDPNNQLSPTPKFDNDVYFSKLYRNLTMDPLKISLNNETYTSDVLFFLNGSDAALFRVQRVSNQITLSLAEGLQFSNIRTRPYLQVVLQAHSPDLLDYGWTAIVVLMPNIAENFHFVKNLYEGFIDDAGNLDIEPVAFESSTYTADIKFELHGIYSDFFQLIRDVNFLSLNFTSQWNNALALDDFISLELIATKNELHTSTIVLLKVIADEMDVIRPSGSQAYALLIREIEEERPHIDILATSIGECQYHIASVYPADKTYVYINESTQMLSSIAIDREDDTFANMTIPQVRVELKLYCKSIRKRAAEIANFNEIIALDIPYGLEQRITVLNLIILDINDNPPVFVHPDQETQTPLYLGYPDSSICFELFPPYLYQVKASDRDVGLNAEIRYSILPNTAFDIDAFTGIIYPKSVFGKEKILLVEVIATDLAGSADGLSSRIQVHIQRLTADYITLLTYETNQTESLDSQLAEFSNAVHLQFSVIKRAILPNNAEDISRLAYNDLRQQAWIYAHNSDDKPVLCRELQEKLQNLTNLTYTNFIVESFEDVGLTSHYGDDDDDLLKDQAFDILSIIYITVITILAITTVVSLYLLFRTNKNSSRPTNSTIASTNFEMNYPSALVSRCTAQGEQNACKNPPQDPFLPMGEVTACGFGNISHGSEHREPEDKQICRGTP